MRQSVKAYTTVPSKFFSTERISCWYPRVLRVSFAIVTSISLPLASCLLVPILPELRPDSWKPPEQ